MSKEFMKYDFMSYNFISLDFIKCTRDEPWRLQLLVQRRTLEISTLVPATNPGDFNSWSNDERW